MEKEEKIIKYSVKVSETMDKKIREILKEKGFSSKQDFIMNAIEVYMNKDASATSDRAYIPKSRVNVQYENILAEIKQSEAQLALKYARNQVLDMLVFELLFMHIRRGKISVTRNEFDDLLKKI